MSCRSTISIYLSYDQARTIGASGIRPKVSDQSVDALPIMQSINSPICERTELRSFLSILPSYQFRSDAAVYGRVAIANAQSFGLRRYSHEHERHVHLQV